jgi:hypothetical protein
MHVDPSKKHLHFEKLGPLTGVGAGVGLGAEVCGDHS